MSEIALFEQKEIRRIWQDEKWYFSVVDVVAVLTDSADPRQYIKRMRARDSELSVNWGTICTQVQMIAADGKRRKVQAADAEGLLRIIQSIPSPKAEPFKRWLAAVGAERIREISDPEIAATRAQELYRKKGYPDDWIALRARGIATRAELTNEWKNRGIDESSDYAILTAEISKAAFGMTPSEYKRLKGLKSENLRDHMTTLELLFTELSEAATTEIARNDDAQGMVENTDAARRGGKIAGDARENLERQTGRKVSTPGNYKHLSARRQKKLPEGES
jgi:prophage antirepressor-like protein